MNSVAARCIYSFLLSVIMCWPARMSAEVHVWQPDSVAEPDTCIHLPETVVTNITGRANARHTPVPVSLMTTAQLRRTPSVNIIDAISRIPGVSQLSSGNGVSKPVIRGLGHNRVVVIDNGVRQEGQQWGDDHGVEIDGASVSSVEVLKGPSSLMYGSDALAGTIIMHDAPDMSEGSHYAEAGAAYHTNDGLIRYSLDTRGNESGILWDVRWSQKWAHDYKSPRDGYVNGTAFAEWALNAMTGIKKDWGSSRLYLSAYHMKPGLTEDGAEYRPGSTSYSIAVPYQHIMHWKAVWDNYINIGSDMLTLRLGYQNNHRREYEHAHGDHDHSHHHGDGGHDHDHDSEAEVHEGLALRLHTLTYDTHYIMHDLEEWTLNFGVGGMYQKSVNLGEEFLIPDYSLFDFGVFATAARSWHDRWHLSAGLRYDFRNLDSRELMENGAVRFEPFSRRFNAVSGSVGAVWNATPGLDVRLNVSRGFRAPGINELASNGSHEGTFRYELGDRTLLPEESWQADAGLDYITGIFKCGFSLFANRISNYIFLQRTDSYSGTTPIYEYTAGDARILGGEVYADVNIVRGLSLSSNFSYVDSRLIHELNSNRYLPFTPAPRWLSTLHYDFGIGGTEGGFRAACYAEVEADLNFRQNHVNRVNATETPTPFYALFNVSAGADLYLPNRRKLCTVCLTLANALNRSYVSHLSRLKYADTASVTGHNGLCNPGRSLSASVLFPLSF